MKTALILDPDIGFGFWLARSLDQSDYQSFPAKSVADASALLDELRIEVDLLILNVALPDSAELIESLRRLNEELKVVALIGDQPRFARHRGPRGPLLPQARPHRGQTAQMDLNGLDTWKNCYP